MATLITPDHHIHRDAKNDLHRVDGPAIIWMDGTELWYQHGKLHREDGPAVEHANGLHEWYRDGKLHREDGPALTHRNGDTETWLDGVRQDQQAADVED